MKYLRLVSLILFCSCSTVKYVPLETTTTIRDTIIRDTVFIEIKKEAVRDFCDMGDTLILENDYSVAEVKLDTIKRVLKGELKTKPKIIEKEVEVVVPLIEKERDVPIEVVKEVQVYPKLMWWSIGLNVLIILIILFKWRRIAI